MNTITILETKYLALKNKQTLADEFGSIAGNYLSAYFGFSDMEEESLHDYKNPARKKAIARTAGL